MNPCCIQMQHSEQLHSSLCSFHFRTIIPQPTYPHTQFCIQYWFRRFQVHRGKISHPSDYAFVCDVGWKGLYVPQTGRTISIVTAGIATRTIKVQQEHIKAHCRLEENCGFSFISRQPSKVPPCNDLEHSRLKQQGNFRLKIPWDLWFDQNGCRIASLGVCKVHICFYIRHWPPLPWLSYACVRYLTLTTVQQHGR